MPSITLILLCLGRGHQATPPLRLVREFSLDVATGVTFGVIGGMDIGPDGSIALVDNGNGVIYRFTPAGKLRDSLGHRGQGPGEFLASAGLSIGPGGEVALADIRTRRITVWNPDGKLRGSTSVTNGMPIDLIRRGPAPILGNHDLRTGIAGQRQLRARDDGRSGHDGSGHRSLPRSAEGGLRDRRHLRYVPAGALTRRAARCSAGHDLSNQRNRSRWARGAKLEALGYRGGAPDRRGSGRARAATAAGPGGGRPNPEGRPSPVIPRGDIRYRPRVQGFGFDASGRLLALVSNAGSTRPVVDVFAGDGTFLGTVKLAEHLTAFVARGTRVIGLSETADGEHVVHVYRVEVP